MDRLERLERMLEEVYPEVKSQLRAEYFEEFRRKLENLVIYEPEYREKRIVPIFAAFKIPEDLMSVGTRRGVLLVRMGGEYLEAKLNFKNDLKRVDISQKIEGGSYENEKGAWIVSYVNNRYYIFRRSSFGFRNLSFSWN